MKCKIKLTMKSNVNLHKLWRTMLEGLRQTEMVKKTSAALVQCVILVIERRRRTLAVSTLTLSIRRKRKCMKIA